MVEVVRLWRWLVGGVWISALCRRRHGRGSAKTICKAGQGYKLFGQRCKEGMAGVGVLVAERWVEKVIEVRRVCEGIVLLRVAVGKSVFCVVSVYAPQVGRPMEEFTVP
jgi:hypothetical protein